MFFVFSLFHVLENNYFFGDIVTPFLAYHNKINNIRTTCVYFLVNFGLNCLPVCYMQGVYNGIEDKERS
jgi:hypothetical protein